MNPDPETNNLTPLQRALFAVKDMRSRLEAVERARTEPIAIIGAGCRFPGGVVDLESFWQLLDEGREAITEVPPDRWDVDAFYDPDPNTPGKMTTRRGGFIENVDLFDASFFGISPREAASMDPQQRLFLEVGWEALENAGIAPGSLNGSLTGVFAGISTSDYFQVHSTGDVDQIDAYSGTGGAFSVAAGRMSYALGLNGPNLPVDTACSSSLVAVHLACQSLRQRECNLALAGGVNLILSPAGTIYFSKLRAMARDGRCKTFDASADGYVRSEGCGFVVLERLSDAQARGRNILAVVLGSAVNHDGRSGGLTAPSRFAQESVLRSALTAAGLKATDVDYVEAHGTGTPLGDPIEMSALVAAAGEGRDRDHRLLVGSVKTNIGHTEAAAGIAGLIKLVLAIQNSRIPAHLNFRNPNPYVPWSEIPVSIPVNSVTWSSNEKRRIAGVSSFGFSGTNAHVVVAEAPPAGESNAAGSVRPVHVLPISARTRPALLELAKRFARHVAEHGTQALADVCHTAGTGRSHFGYRAAIVLHADRAELRESLLACAEDRSRANLYAAPNEQSGSPRIGFVFSDSGISDHDIDDLYETQPAFRRAFDHCRELSKGRPGPEHNLRRFTIQFALTEMWKSWGVQPAVVIGDGCGEYAAACAAGITTLPEALEVMAGAEIQCRSGVIPFISAFSGDVVRFDKDGIPLHWRGREMTGPRWAEAMQSATRLGCEVLIEIGLPGTEHVREVVMLPSLGSRGNWPALAESVAQLYIQGADIDWAGFDKDFGLKTVPLPTYPFQRQRHWLSSAPKPGTVPRPAPGPACDDLENWLFEVRWEENAAAVSEINPSTWIILSDASDVDTMIAGKTARDLEELLRSRGSEAICIARGESYETGGRLWRIDPEVPENFDLALADAANLRGRPCAGVVWLWDIDSPPKNSIVETSRQLSTAALHLVQALARAEGRTASPNLWLVTRRVHCVAPADDASGLSQSVLWGFGRGVALEHSPLWGGLIDLGAEDSKDAAAILLQIGGSPAGTECAFRDGRRYVPRLAERRVDAGAPLHVSGDATYVITGGLGALGLQAALWLANSEARNLVLVGRRPASAAARAALSELETSGVRVRAVYADVASLQDMRTLFESVASELPPIRGIVHAAGVLEDGVILRQNSERFERVFAPKISGAWNLHTLSAGLNLDFFVLLSSAASFFGSPGQSGYAAANAFMDALAAYRHSRSLPAISLNCGPWENLGMSQSRRPIPGVVGITPEKGMRAVELAISSGQPQLGILPFDWELFARQFSTGRVPTLLENIVRPQTSSVRESVREEADILASVQRAAQSEKPGVITEYLKRRLHRIAGMSVDDISVSRDLLELGVDSLMAMELIQGIRQDLSLALYPREFYEHPSIASLSTYLASELERLSTASASPVVTIVESKKPPRREFDVTVERTRGVLLLLSSPRSGSTLLRVMLAGHPHLFCPPELHLLPFATMGERKSLLGASYLDEGLQRALMEAGNLDAAASRALTDDLVKRDVPIVEVYGMLKEMVGTRLLIDKSPTYASDMQTLRRAETLFDGAKYIHLVRHPVAMIESFVRNRMDKLAGHSGDPWRIAAQLWADGNSNLLEFFTTVDDSRHCRLHFEALVRDPESAMKTLCTFIGVPFDEAVLRPYEGRRMTDGVHSKSLAIGDPNFLDHDHIEASKADVWRQQTLPASIQQCLEPAAAVLGYGLSGSNGMSCAAGAESAMRERFLDARGRRISVCDWGGETGPLVVCVHGMLDHGAAWQEVAVELVNAGFRVIAPDLRGHGLSDHESPASSYHLLDFVADLDSILAGDTFTLVGHSFGAVIASLYSLARPERVQSLVLVEPPSLLRAQQRKRLDGLIAQLDQFASPAAHPVFPDLSSVAVRLQRSVPGISAAQADRHARRLTRLCDGGFTWRWDPRLRARFISGLDSLASETYSDISERFAGRVSFVYGSSGITADGREEMSGAANRRITITGSHNLHLESPSAVAATVIESCRTSKATVASPGRRF